VFETYWTNGRGAEAMDNSYALMDLAVYGRQEAWEDSPAGWPQSEQYAYRTNGRPIAHCSPRSRTLGRPKDCRPLSGSQPCPRKPSSLCRWRLRCNDNKEKNDD
jgi:Bacterial protein of unknown function (DUF899)